MVLNFASQLFPSMRADHVNPTSPKRWRLEVVRRLRTRPVNRSLFILCFGLLVSTTPAFARVQETAEKSRTMATLANLRMALKYYYDEYRALPTGDAKAIMAVLTATNTDGQNPRKIVFFEFHQPRKRFGVWTTDPGNRASDGAATDGWRRALIWTIDTAKPAIAIRSLGPNGRDDAGQPDDVTVSYAPN